MSESSLSYKGAALSGPPWAVISVVVLLVIGGLFGLAMWLDGDGGEVDQDPPEVEISTAVSTVAPLTEDPGDELLVAWLDELATYCTEGDLFACDELFWEAPVGTEWENLGATCGYLEPAWTFAGACSE